MRIRGKSKLIWALSVLTTLFPTAAISGCGGEGRSTKTRLPAAISVNVAIGKEQVSVSPRKLGAGPANFIVSNQSGGPRRLVLSGNQVERSTATIDNLGSAEIQIALEPGEYTISAGHSTAIQPETLTVTGERPSSQNELLLP